MPPPTSFIICDICVSYPKRRIFDIFQQKKICIVESIEFIVTENHLCHASVYVSKWYTGKISEKFVEKLMTERSLEFTDHNHCTWKIIPTPLIIQRKASQKWFQQKVSTENSENKDVMVVKIKPKPTPSGKKIQDLHVGETMSDISLDYDTDNDIDSLFAETESDFYDDYDLFMMPQDV